MKTTLEIPDSIFRRAKVRAAQQGIPLRQFVSEAVEEKIRGVGEKPWMRMVGQLRHLRKETGQIDRLIEEEFEKIEPEEWT
ncbi:MAG TPA: hypothetical protein VGV35_17155 [Bryobacteraceae bacterium]|nr:hypothetical protein [Bryobacteraceae bacterium]